MSVPDWPAGSRPPYTQPPGDDARPCCVKGGLFILFVSLSSPLCSLSLSPRLSSTAFLKGNEFAEKSKKEKVFRCPDAVNNHMSANTCCNDQYQLSERLLEQVLRLLLPDGWEEVAKAAAHFC